MVEDGTAWEVWPLVDSKQQYVLCEPENVKSLLLLEANMK